MIFVRRGFLTWGAFSIISIRLRPHYSPTCRGLPRCLGFGPCRMVRQTGQEPYLSLMQRSISALSISVMRPVFRALSID